MRVSVLASLLVVCGCASGGGHSSELDTPMMQQRVEMTRVETPTGVIQIDWQRERTYDETKLLVGVDKAWAAVPAVFGELGIEPGVIDSKQHVYGNAGANHRRQLGGQRMSRYFDCGSTVGIENADEYDLLIRVITQIIPAEAGLSTLRTQAEATAHANALSGQVVRCASTGALEARIAHMVSEQAVRAGR
ncbi:MAG: hypothetical protein JJD97_03395 [Gemmatimonadaceae bacterium]|nr:hypothetical protein [Gemmatimonadaceae bacterium]